jgi:hypothetical protein
MTIVMNVVIINAIVAYGLDLPSPLRQQNWRIEHQQWFKEDSFLCGAKFTKRTKD